MTHHDRDHDQHDHDIHDAAKAGTTQSWHVWLWSALIIAGMIALVVVIQAR